MQLNVNFVYEAAVRYRRKASDSAARYYGTVPVEIRELSGDDAPVAIRFTTSPAYDDAPGLSMELRVHDGDLYEPMYDVPPRSAWDEVASTPRRAAWLAEGAKTAFRRGDTDRKFPLEVGASWERYGVLGKASDDANLKHVVSSTEQEIAAKVTRNASALLLVDGVLHRKCPEPVYRIEYVSADRRGERSYSYLSLVFGGDKHHADREYRLDELGYVREHRPNVRIDEGLAELLVPEALRSDIPHRRHLKAASDVYDWMRARVADGDHAFFSAYHDLREAMAVDATPVARGDVALGGEPAAAAVEALGRIGQVVEGVLARIEDVPSDKRSDFESTRGRLEALGAWRSLDDRAIASL